MKLIIAGGRKYELTEDHFEWLDAIPGVTEVVSGCAKGADEGGEQWAKLRGLKVKRFPALWGVHGRRAGHLRNIQMAVYADALALFPGGRGSADMKRRATTARLKIFEYPERIRL